ALAKIRLDQMRTKADTLPNRIAPPSMDNRVVLARLSQGRRVITVKSGACSVSGSWSTRPFPPPGLGPTRTYATRSSPSAPVSICLSDGWVCRDGRQQSKADFRVVAQGDRDRVSSRHVLAGNLDPRPAM